MKRIVAFAGASVSIVTYVAEQRDSFLLIARNRRGCVRLINALISSGVTLTNRLSHRDEALARKRTRLAITLLQSRNSIMKIKPRGNTLCTLNDGQSSPFSEPKTMLRAPREPPRLVSSSDNNNILRYFYDGRIFPRRPELF